jgi:hypothetical protein
VANAALQSETADDELIRMLMATSVPSVRSDSVDLSLRQLAVSLNTDPELDILQTPRRLAAALNIPNPAIMRDLDRSAAFGLINLRVRRSPLLFGSA